MEIRSIAVIGGGTMGNGISHAFALKGYTVHLVELKEEFARKSILTIANNLDRQINNGSISDTDKVSTLSRIIPVVGIENTPEQIDLVIEAIHENKQAKSDIFRKLDSLVKPEAIFSSNTSSISITELSANNRPERFIGMHFMNPVPVMKLVEVIRGHLTSDDTCSVINELARKLDKVPVVVADYPGFISNRILMPMINEAIFALMEGVATAEDIDTVMRLGMNHAMGPLALADFIGLDICLAILEVLYNGFNDPKYRPCPLLKKMVAANKLGRKSGEGFFKYNKAPEH